MAIPVYPSDLNEAEWAVLAPLIPAAVVAGRAAGAAAGRPAHHRFVRAADDRLSVTGAAALRLDASAATTRSPACALSFRNGL